tara:strand:- start:313 stop:648 length:336 start_codon:yes stop_codon:yes gene_type:complete
MASIVGKALRGFGKALRAHRIKHGKRGKTITGVKPLSGKIPKYVSGSAKERARQVRTHFHVKRIDKVNKAKEQIKEGKKTLKHMEDTGQAEQYKNYKGEPTGEYRPKWGRD